MDSALLVQSHTGISLVAIVAGFVVLYGLFAGKRLPATTAIFLITTAATSISGFFFHRDHLLPSHIVGIVALVVMVPTLLALYVFHLRGIWRPVYLVGAVVSLWFNVFVLIAQAFQKVPALDALAPQGNEPPFGIAEGVVLLIFIVIAVAAVRSRNVLRLQPAF